jgi:glutaredoxin
MLTLSTGEFKIPVLNPIAGEHIHPTDINVAQDREKAKEMMQKSGQMGVPVIIIDDNEIVVGFNQSLLDKLFS